ncbi:hypothetical protein Tcan_00973, partial [Toxocara canis]
MKLIGLESSQNGNCILDHCSESLYGISWYTSLLHTILHEGFRINLQRSVEHVYEIVAKCHRLSIQLLFHKLTLFSRISLCWSISFRRVVRVWISLYTSASLDCVSV